jgi:hypothetical protein
MRTGAFGLAGLFVCCCYASPACARGVFHGVRHVCHVVTLCARGNWNAAAGLCGGAAPRFNIAKQSKEHDPSGEYVRHWLGLGGGPAVTPTRMERAGAAAAAAAAEDSEAEGGAVVGNGGRYDRHYRSYLSAQARLRQSQLPGLPVVQ